MSIIERARSFIGRFHDGPDVLTMTAAIARRWPEMAAYCRIARVDTPWCGIFWAYVLTLEDIRPPYSANGSDYDDFMWADAAVEGRWGTAVTRQQVRPGDAVVLRVPHHITIFDRDAGDGQTFWATGGNQSEPGTGGGVTTARFYYKNVRAFVRPPGQQVIDENPLIKLGDSGESVKRLQRLLGLTATGRFDEETDREVREYQASRGLEVDGEVGPLTWNALLTGAPPGGAVPHAAEYRSQWNEMEILPDKLSVVDQMARQALSHKATYLAVEKTTGVPWFLVAGLHMRESTFDFETQLAQGDPLDEVSTHVPKGRGPFPDWQSGARDALVTLKHLDRVKVWTVEVACSKTEEYNGPGYRNHGVPSAYLWSFSTIYRGGKYVHDGPTGWRPDVFDQQCGVMTMIRHLMTIDPSVKFDDAAVPETEETEAPRRRDAAVLLLMLIIARRRGMTEKQSEILSLLVPLVGELIRKRRGSPTDVPASTQPDDDPLGDAISRILDRLKKDQEEPAEADEPPPLKEETPASLDLRTGAIGIGAYVVSVLGGLLGNPLDPATSAGSVALPAIVAVLSGVGVPSWIIRIGGRLLRRRLARKG